MLSQVLPSSILQIIPIFISVLFNALTALLGAYFVKGRTDIQNSLIFAAVTYFALFFIRLAIPLPSLPFISTFLLVEALIKSGLAMRLFDANFHEGFCIAGVQMLFGSIIALPI